MWIVLASFHACWCSSTMHVIAFERDFVIFNVILAPSYNTTPSPHGDGSMAKMISLDEEEEVHIRKVLIKADGVRKFAICLILKSFNMLSSNNEC
jgi:hypothetical protein